MGRVLKERLAKQRGQLTFSDRWPPLAESILWHFVEPASIIALPDGWVQKNWSQFLAWSLALFSGRSLDAQVVTTMRAIVDTFRSGWVVEVAEQLVWLLSRRSAGIYGMDLLLDLAERVQESVSLHLALDCLLGPLALTFPPRTQAVSLAAQLLRECPLALADDLGMHLGVPSLASEHLRCQLHWPAGRPWCWQPWYGELDGSQHLASEVCVPTSCWVFRWLLTPAISIG